MPKVRITDVSLRDGSHPIFHQFTREHIVNIAGALDKAGVPVLEVTHGDGLAGSSIQYGFSKVDVLKVVEAAVAVVKQAEIAVLLLPGVGTIHDLNEAHKRG